MIRVVLDTNILVSALLNPHGAPSQVFLLSVAEPDIHLCVTGDIFAEYEEVLLRARFRRSRSEIDTALGAIREKALWFRPAEKVLACSDPDDNIFLECAVAADAHYLVTGNVNHFPHRWADTRILNPRQFLDAVG